MKSLENDRVGLVLFAGSGYVQMPLTFDHNAAQMIVSVAAPSGFRSEALLWRSTTEIKPFFPGSFQTF